MAKYSIVVVAALLFTCLGAHRCARAQVAADLGASSGAVDFSATGMSANLSASNGAGASGASALGGRLKAQTQSLSYSQGRSIQSSTLLTASLTGYGASPKAPMKRYYEALQNDSSPSPRPRTRAIPSTALGTSPGFAPVASLSLGVTGKQATKRPRSFASQPAALQTPVYSFLMKFEGMGLPSKPLQQNRSEKSKHGRSARDALFQSLTSNRNGGGSVR
jgi:hypothetical protein